MSKRDTTVLSELIDKRHNSSGGEQIKYVATSNRVCMLYNNKPRTFSALIKMKLVFKEDPNGLLCFFVCGICVECVLNMKSN